MAEPVVLQGVNVAIFAGQVTTLGSITDGPEDKHRHYSVSVSIPGATVLHGMTPHLFDGPPDQDKPLNWLAGPIAYQDKAENGVGQVVTTFKVANYSSTAWPPAAGASFEVRRLAL